MKTFAPALKYIFFSGSYFINTCMYGKIELYSCYTPFKKVMQHNFNGWYQFVYGFVIIMLGIIWKLGYLSFH